MLILINPILFFLIEISYTGRSELIVYLLGDLKLINSYLTKQKTAPPVFTCVIVKRNQKIYSVLLFCSKIMKPDEQLFCGTCTVLKRQTEATTFCKTCQDPEPLCGSCAQHHICQKATRGHVLCDDLSQMSKYPVASEKR